MVEISKTKSYGHFENKGETFVITDIETPRHWYNYFFNDEYVAFTSQVGFGEGLCQDEMGRRIFLVAFIVVSVVASIYVSFFSLERDRYVYLNFAKIAACYRRLNAHYRLAYDVFSLKKRNTKRIFQNIQKHKIPHRLGTYFYIFTYRCICDIQSYKGKAVCLRRRFPQLFRGFTGTKLQRYKI